MIIPNVVAMTLMAIKMILSDVYSVPILFISISIVFRLVSHVEMTTNELFRA